MARDVKRIDRILDEIKNTWKLSENNDMRFFQLLINMGLLPDNNVLWHLEDERIEEHLKNHPLKKDKTKKKEREK